MDLKLCEAKENYFESIDNMKIEVENLKACLTERDSRIDRLESELFIVKDHCKTDYQLLRVKYEDYKLELELLKEKRKEENLEKFRNDMEDR